MPVTPAGSASGERPDLRLVPPALGAWLATLVLLGASPAAALASAAAAAAAAGGLATGRCRRHRWANGAAAALVCAAAAGLSVGLRLAAVADGPVRTSATEGGQATVELVVGGDPRVQPPEVSDSELRRHVLIPGRAETLRARGERRSVRAPVLVIASGPGWESVLPSHRVRVQGQLELPRYDELVSAVVFARGPPQVVGGPSPLQQAAGRIRAGLRQAVAPLPPNQQGLLPGLVVGDRSQMPARLAEDFRVTGLTHLTAVSGTNVSIVLVTVLGLARLLGLGARAPPLLAGCGVLAFAVLARPSPSVLRATVMGLIAVVALATGRQRHALPALCAAVTGLVLFQPGLARSYGFTLSVLATVGLIVLVPGWSDRVGRRVPRRLVQALAVPAAAQLACLPVIVMLAGRVSLVAVPANVLAAPAVAPATVLGVLAAVAAPVWLPAARLLARPAGWAAHWISEIASAGAGLPHATVSWPSGLAGGLALAAVLLAVVLARRPLRWVAAACLAGVLLAAAGLRVVAPAWPPPNWVVAMCDVGQGDAVVLSAGRRGAVVVDSGPDPRSVHRCLQRLHVQRVPLVVLTHWHADHTAGLQGVLRGRQVGAVLAGPVPDAGARIVPVRAWLRAADVPARRAVAGQRWRVGPLRFRVLGPRGRMLRPPGQEENVAKNNASVVIRASWAGKPSTTALLAGDIEPDAQRALLPSAGRADVLKVPHHGSASQAPEFLAAADPRLALVSAGAGNDYGHPSRRTIRMLRRLGARVYRTDRDGAVAVIRREEGLAVVAREGTGTPPALPPW